MPSTVCAQPSHQDGVLSPAHPQASLATCFLGPLVCQEADIGMGLYMQEVSCGKPYESTWGGTTGPQRCKMQCGTDPCEREVEGDLWGVLDGSEWCEGRSCRQFPLHGEWG